MTEENGGLTAGQLTDALIYRVVAQAHALAIEAIEGGSGDWGDDPDYVAVHMAMHAVIDAMGLEMVIAEVATRIMPLVAGRHAAIREE
jgi:hypothetical protein